jgi:hypothetical protein
VRASADLSAERMNAKIRDAQLMKVPYMLVVGDQEMANHTVALRKRDGSRLNDFQFGDFLALVNQKIATRRACIAAPLRTSAPPRLRVMPVPVQTVSHPAPRRGCLRSHRDTEMVANRAKTGYHYDAR